MASKSNLIKQFEKATLPLRLRNPPPWHDNQKSRSWSTNRRITESEYAHRGHSRRYIVVQHLHKKRHRRKQRSMTMQTYRSDEAHGETPGVPLCVEALEVHVPRRPQLVGSPIQDKREWFRIGGLSCPGETRMVSPRPISVTLVRGEDRGHPSRGNPSWDLHKAKLWYVYLHTIHPMDHTHPGVYY